MIAKHLVDCPVAKARLEQQGRVTVRVRAMKGRGER